MTLFGGFSERVFAAYHEAFPLEPGWRDRHALYRLYHVINHLEPRSAGVSRGDHGDRAAVRVGAGEIWTSLAMPVSIDDPIRTSARVKPYGCSPRRPSTPRSSSSVTSSTVIVAPIAVAMTKCSRPLTTFLSRRTASMTSADRQVGDRRQRAERGDQRRPAPGGRAAPGRRARRPGRRRRACRRRSPRRGGSGGTWSPPRARGRWCGRS